MAERDSWQSPDRAEAIRPEVLMAGDDRRMQVRAYKFWVSLLNGGPVPRLSALRLDALPDFAASSILIELGGASPAIRFLGEELRHEAGLPLGIETLAQVPPRSLISRLTDRCAELSVSQSAMGFEAEFLNHKGQETLYRGLLLPFSSDGVDVDHAYGVISWKTRAEPRARHMAANGRSADLLRAKPDRALWLDSAPADWIRQARKRG